MIARHVRLTFAEGSSCAAAPSHCDELGGYWTEHGDFYSGWDQSVLTERVQMCLDPPDPTSCGAFAG